jgi:hemoglobin
MRRRLGSTRSTSAGSGVTRRPSAIVRQVSPDGQLRDLESRADCERLVRAFYTRALADPIIGWIFVDVAKLDLEAHVPRIASFWETILLGARSYSGGAFAPHAALHARVRLRAGHFERWLELWHATVDELFVGERAELAKTHAVRVADAFQRRLSALPFDEDSSTRVAGELVVTMHAPPHARGGGDPTGRR